MIYIVRSRINNLLFPFDIREEAEKMVEEDGNLYIDECILWESIDHLRNYDGAF